MIKDDELFTDPEHHWQTSNLVKCVVSTAAPYYKQCDLESETKN